MHHVPMPLVALLFVIYIPVIVVILGVDLEGSLSLSMDRRLLAFSFYPFFHRFLPVVPLRRVARVAGLMWGII